MHSKYGGEEDEEEVCVGGGLDWAFSSLGSSTVTGDAITEAV